MDELYVIARRVLLDALEAFGPHRDAAILVGAQAIYLHTGDAELAVAEYTTDADLALDILRILQGIETDVLTGSLRRILNDERSQATGERVLGLLTELFGTRGSEGAVMAARATRPLMDETEVRLRSELLAQDLISSLSKE